MQRLTENKIVLVKRRTRLNELVSRFNTIAQAKFYVEHSGADFSDYQSEDETYQAALSSVESSLRSLGRLQVIDRSFLPNFLFGNDDTVVALGQDGLVANTLKYLSTQPLLGVNPDPNRWDGVLLPFKIADIPKIIPEVFKRGRPIKRVTMARARLNNGQTLLGVNDIFVGPKSHTSARYVISIGGKEEHHSSSGLIVSTGLGSTGWLKSILAGSAGVASYMSDKHLAFRSKTEIAWDSPSLYYTVREPFPSKTTDAHLVFGKLTEDTPMKLVSLMPEHGVIFSDGIEADFLQFNSGAEAAIGIADKVGHLVV